MNQNQKKKADSIKQHFSIWTFTKTGLAVGREGENKLLDICVIYSEDSAL